MKKNNKVKEKPQGLWTLCDISEETKKLVKGYAQERGEKLGVCVDRLLKEAMKLPDYKKLIEELLEKQFQSIKEFEEEIEDYKKPWWRFWG